jgi:DNA-binding response OmpR family regulator
MELGLLVALAREPSRVYTKAELLRDVWGYPSSIRTRTLDSHASRLRRKLVAAGAPKGRYVIAVWGVGYSLVKSS